ncbi:MAG TPA: DUF262 domain-containing protein [Acidimicrobiales bacterium]|nr:DUF262 domain-containing protein [Acidimicrobiales bacterium]
MATPTLKIDTVKVRQLIADYRAGRIVIPEFQRDYVWHKSRAPRLLDSLYRSFPISTLLYWRSADGARARRTAPKPAAGQMHWLIDGQQRVMTLSRVASGDEGIDVVFNPATDEFSNANAATRNDPTWVRVADLFDDATYRELRRELPASNKGKKLEDSYERVRSLLDYDVPVVLMLDHSFDAAVDAFTRINSLGVRLKQQDIESAQIAARHTGLIADQVVPFMQKLETKGFPRLTVMHLFRVCAFLATPNAHVKTPLHEMPRADVMKAWRETEKATLTACALIRSELGLVNMDILWSGALLAPVIAIVANTRPIDRDPRGLAAWLALAALMHRYSGASETALDQDLRACRAEDPIGALLRNLRQRRTSLLAKPSDFAGALNDRGGMFASYVACKNKKVKDFFTGQTILLDDNIDRHHIFPRRQFPESIRRSADTVANIAFVTSDVNKAISHTGPEVYLADIKPAILESQCVPLDPLIWRIKQADAFFAARRKLLADSFNDYLRRSLLGRKL